jgi:hypothetical protein
MLRSASCFLILLATSLSHGCASEEPQQTVPDVEKRVEGPTPDDANESQADEPANEPLIAPPPAYGNKVVRRKGRRDSTAPAPSGPCKNSGRSWTRCRPGKRKN